MSEQPDFTGTRPVPERHRLDVVALQGWLRAHVEGYEGPLEVAQFKGGQSNPTYLLTTPARRYVLRAKPGPAARLLPSAHAVEREYRVQAALRGAGVPVARVHALCEDEGVIGRAFYVMEHVAGRIFGDHALPGLAPAERAAIYAELGRVMAALHRAPWEALGLADFGKPGNYFARQIERWTRQYRASETGRLEAMERLIAWLPAHAPREEPQPVSVVHGDFRIDNVVFHPTEPRILAVLDWELSTLGHPLADFAYHCAMAWHAPPGRFRGLAGLDLGALGIPEERAHLAAYLEATGLSLAGDWNFYLAYNLFRVACILQGVLRRAVDGVASSAEALETGSIAGPIAELAWSYAQRAGSARGHIDPSP